MKDDITVKAPGLRLVETLALATILPELHEQFGMGR